MKTEQNGIELLLVLVLLAAIAPAHADDNGNNTKGQSHLDLLLSGG